MSGSIDRWMSWMGWMVGLDGWDLCIDGSMDGCWSVDDRIKYPKADLAFPITGGDIVLSLQVRAAASSSYRG